MQRMLKKPVSPCLTADGQSSESLKPEFQRKSVRRWVQALDWSSINESFWWILSAVTLLIIFIGFCIPDGTSFLIWNR